MDATRHSYMKKLFLLFAFSLLASCNKSPSLQGNWSVDVAATVDRARTAGLPDSTAGQIREIYEGGLLEITSDTLTMRISGIPDAISHNYKVTDKSGGCYSLEISGTQGTHSYCLEDQSLVVRDPSAKIAIVYSGR